MAPSKTEELAIKLMFNKNSTGMLISKKIHLENVFKLYVSESRYCTP